MNISTVRIRPDESARVATTRAFLDIDRLRRAHAQASARRLARVFMLACEQGGSETVREYLADPARVDLFRFARSYRVHPDHMAFFCEFVGVVMQARRREN